MTTTIAPSLGNAPLFMQQGAPLGYDAIDLRRFLAIDRQEGPIDFGSYKVTQRVAGVNLSVDIAASTGRGALIDGDTVAAQGSYYAPPHGAPINEAITAADSTNPRNDLAVLEVLDDTHASGGLNLSRVRVITGTPNASAAKDDAYGVNGTPSVPSSAIPLAVVNVPASDTTISDSQISDRRPGVPSIIATEEAVTSTSYARLATPDTVHGVVVPEASNLVVGFQGMWKESVSGAARAAIHIRPVSGAWNQLKMANTQAAAPAVRETTLLQANIYKPLASTPRGLFGESEGGSDYVGNVLTGQALGVVIMSLPTANSAGECVVHSLPAGTYDVSIQVKSTSGSVTMKERKLWARGQQH